MHLTMINPGTVLGAPMDEHFCASLAREQCRVGEDLDPGRAHRHAGQRVSARGDAICRPSLEIAIPHRRQDEADREHGIFSAITRHRNFSA